MTSSAGRGDETTAQPSVSVAELGQEQSLPLAALVRVLRGEQVLSTTRLVDSALVLGAAPGSDILVEDAAVSRAHLKLSLSPEGVHALDLGSRNGTFFLGQRLTDMTLSLGSEVSLGELTVRFEADVEDFEGTQGAAVETYGDLVGRSFGMQRLFTLMRRLEGSLVSVLIEGESGTGKELVARALHEHSQVKSGPFVAINCGALERSLVRTELFGHKKGAFTGALSDAVGVFEAANGGTLFLDEIGELPLEVQPVLLRVLETGEFCRVGETRPRQTKVRLIAATNRDLGKDAEEGVFRQDLYYRLKVVSLSTPPLSARPEDVPVLLGRLAERLKIPPLSDAAMREFCARAYPGNVRELKHALLSYSALGEVPSGKVATGPLDAALLAVLNTSLPYAEQKEAIVDQMTRLYLQKLIQETGGNRSEAARVAELQRGYLRRLLEKYGLD